MVLSNLTLSSYRIMISLLYTNEESVHQNKVVRLSNFGKIVGIVDFLFL